MKEGFPMAINFVVRDNKLYLNVCMYRFNYLFYSTICMYVCMCTHLYLHLVIDLCECICKYLALVDSIAVVKRYYWFYVQSFMIFCYFLVEFFNSIFFYSAYIG